MTYLRINYLVKPVMWLAVALAFAIVIFSTFHLSANQVDLSCLIFTLIAINIGTRINVKTPGTDEAVSLSQLFIVLSMFFFSGGAVVLIAAVVGMCASLRFGKNRTALLFESSIAVISVSLTLWVMRYFFGTNSNFSQLKPFDGLLISVCFIALISATIQLGGSIISRAYNANVLTWRIIGKAYASTFTTYLVIASAAVAIVELVNIVGLYKAILAGTFITIANFAYCTYLKNAHSSIKETIEVESTINLLQEKEELLRSTFDSTAIGMALVSPTGQLLYVNKSLCKSLGFSAEELLAKSVQTILHPDDVSAVDAQIKKLVKAKSSGQSHQLEKRCIHKYGYNVPIQCNISRVVHSRNNDVHLVFQIQDITERKRTEGKLLHDAFHDPLTKLPNRALFMDHLKVATARAKRHEDKMFAVIYLDLDRFKTINDSLGHQFGDQLLIGTAQRLANCVRPEDTIARLGGDEFTVLVGDIKEESDAVYVAERIQKELSAPFILGKREVFTTVSIGIALSTTGYEHAEEVLRDADTAMYRAKSSGKARHEIFDKAMHARAVNLLQLENDLRGAVENEEFFLQYQPIVSLDTFTIYGFEALVRWQHPERGLISPLDFIPIAEENGQIIPIGHWALKTACKQIKRWQGMYQGDQPLTMSVNVSGKQFNQPNLTDQVKEILDETSLSPRTLKLELTESIVMDNIDVATQMLNQLRELGVQLSIDDFGTGYSSLSYLHRFPIDTLKIDRSFVMHMVDNSENTEIVRTIVMLAQNLGMDVVAEGVETKEQLALLRKLGCENGQGYYFSKPKIEAEIDALLLSTQTQLKPQRLAQMKANVSDKRIAAVR